MNNYQRDWSKTELYRLPDEGMIAGVCAGLADHFGIAKVWVRLGAIVTLFAFNGLAVIAYIALAIIMKPLHSKKCYEKPEGTSRQSRSAQAARQRLEAIDERLANVERYVTSNRYRLNKQFEELR